MNDFQGQNCTNQKETQLFSGVQLYYDHITPVNTAQNVMIVLDVVGETVCTLELQTHNYVVLSVKFPTGDNTAFRHTGNIRKTAQELGILRRSLMPESHGFYLVAKATIVSKGQSMLGLTITDSETDVNYFGWYFEHATLIDEESVCFPVIQLPAWY